jgi:tRNA threonylcarbamoyladenosine biosynthesis protein TsaB
MRVLAFDCAGGQCAGTVLIGDKPAVSRRIVAERDHARLLMPMLIDLLSEACLRFDDVDRIAVTTGPGSFTGIRVALAVAHGLALATSARVVGVPVFDVVAASALPIETDRLLVVLESKRPELFVQLFRRDGRATSPPSTIAPEQLAAWVRNNSSLPSGPLTLAGNAAAVVVPFLSDVRLGSAPDWVDTTTLARMSLTLPAESPLSPFYLRSPDAVPTASR